MAEDARTDYDDGIPPPSENPYCLWGWKSKAPCNYTGGCGCWRELGHKGRCKCEMCDGTSQRPKDWDARGRAEANA